MKEMEDRFAQLSRNYKRKLEEIKAWAANLQSTCEHIVRQRQQEAQLVYIIHSMLTCNILVL